ncbi:uncharacterized protein FOMMEDRAFT_170469 [Fomitiporia mediterranea MF3/22]|uniref:uncharacterized protein n=1 Tax=Fomitiporia mediterranea (strain MF3/22) TaxID=694068 RepID=UPI0004407D69|nr:uncharacterized protein FOMMEDRAFT_170469 [Fomitiporia mediterranea MF3/22]EJC99550.1 hypothetical protein FOMMEDRAFT_170469 [Fomitiporia mediterranea MF3/22]
MSDIDKKPDIKPDVTNEKIMLIVRHEEKEVKIALKPHHQMQKLFDAAGKAFQMDAKTLKFVYHNQRLRPNDTAADMEMEDGDEISAFLEQLGGTIWSWS